MFEERNFLNLAIFEDSKIVLCKIRDVRAGMIRHDSWDSDKFASNGNRRRLALLWFRLSLRESAGGYTKCR